VERFHGRATYQQPAGTASHAVADLLTDRVLGARRVVFEQQARHRRRLARWIDCDYTEIAGGAHAHVAFQTFER